MKRRDFLKLLAISALAPRLPDLSPFETPSYEDDIGEIEPAYPRWKNYTAQYGDVHADDLIAKMAAAYEKMTFKAPIPFRIEQI